MRNSNFVATFALFAAGCAMSLVAAAQQSDNSELTVMRCDPVTNSCESAAPTVRTQQRQVPIATGAAERSTILSPSLRSMEVSLDAAEYRVLIPGCVPSEPGVFSCESSHQYQHCRTLMFSHMVHSCRVELAFNSGFAEPVAAAPGSYSLEIDSDARLRVQRGDRGIGNIRGSADVILTFDAPQLGPEDSCLLRDSFLYWETGPDGGMSDVGKPGECGEPMEFSFAPHGDDLMRAHDICETFASWGDEVTDTIDILAAGLFHVHSDDREFRARYPGGTGIVARYVKVKAPVTIECRQ